MTKLSIITPTLNSAETIESTLASIRPLVSCGAEHIVVDSGSTDGTVELVRNSGAILITYPKGNMYAAINSGMRESKAEWVTYINGDDLLYADATLGCLERFGDCASIIYGNIDYVDSHGRFLFSWRSPAPAYLGWLMRYYCPFPQQGTLIRRSVYEQLGGFNVQFRYSSDYDFFVRAHNAGFAFMKYSDKSVAGFRLLPTQLSQSHREQMRPEGERVRARILAGYPIWRRILERTAASVYRITTNLDSRMLRRMRGNGLDRR